MAATRAGLVAGPINHTKLAHSCVTLNEAKGLNGEILRSAQNDKAGGSIAKSTKVLPSGLGKMRQNLFAVQFDLVHDLVRRASRTQDELHAASFDKML